MASVCTIDLKRMLHSSSILFSAMETHLRVNWQCLEIHKNERERQQARSVACLFLRIRRDVILLIARGTNDSVELLSQPAVEKRSTKEERKKEKNRYDDTF